MRTDIRWKVWTRCVMDILSAPSKLPISIIDIGLPFKRSICVGHLQCPNEKCDYLHLNVGLRNNTKWVQSTPTFLYGWYWP